MSNGAETSSGDVNQQERQPTSSSWMWVLPVILVLLAVILIPLGFIVLVLADQEPAASSSSRNTLPGMSATTRESGDTPAGYEATESLLTESAANEQAEAHRLESLRIARQTEWTAVKHRVDAVEKTIDDAERELAAWLKTTDTLDTSADGKRLASDSRLLEQYDAILTQPEITREGLDILRGQLGELRSSISGTLNLETMPSEPAVEFNDQLDRIDTESRTWSKGYSERNQILASLLRRAPEKTADDMKALAEVLALREESRRKTEMEQIVEALKERRAERTSQLLRAKDEAEALVHAAEVQAAERLGQQKAESIRRRTEIAIKQEQEKLVAEEAAAAAEQLKAEYERDLDAIRRYLGPFIRKGYAQPAGHRNQHGAELAPVSFRALQASGALNSGRPGLERLMYLASVQNDRYQKDFPMYIGGENGWQMTDKAFLQKAQDLLNKYGPLMVQEELLSE